MARLTKKYNLSAVQAELKLKKPMIEIELPGGKSVKIEPPQLWPDEVTEFARAGKLTDASKLLFGEEQHEQWRAGGGTNGLLNAIIEEHTQATKGESSAS